MRRSLSLILVIAEGLGGCFVPGFDPTGKPCVDGECPDPYRCVHPPTTATGTCQLASCNVPHIVVPVQPAACGAMKAGEGVSVGTSLKSCDGRFELTLNDGNMALFSFGVEIWNSATWNPTASALVMEQDGDLVLLSSAGCTLWSSGTSNNPGAALSLQDDGDMQLLKGTTWLWGSGTGLIPPAPSACGVIAANHGLAPGETLVSCNGSHSLNMQGNGDLVLYNTTTHQPIWDAMTNGTTFRYLKMHPDGNLSVEARGGNPIWMTSTGGNIGAALEVMDDGNLAVILDGGVRWQSKTSGR